MVRYNDQPSFPFSVVGSEQGERVQIAVRHLLLDGLLQRLIDPLGPGLRRIGCEKIALRKFVRGTVDLCSRRSSLYAVPSCTT